MLSDDDINKYAALQLRTLRSTSGLTQQYLGDEIGISPQQVQKYEWGINRMTVGRAMQFAEAFDVSVSTFFPPRNKHYSFEPPPPATMRFMRLIGKIDPKHYKQLYIGLKAIARMSGSNLE